MATRVPKILCHPDGTIYAEYPFELLTADAHYTSCEDVPPTAVELGIKTAGMSDPEDLIWRPVIVAVAGEPEYEDQVFPYDDETGEAV